MVGEKATEHTHEIRRARDGIREIDKFADGTRADKRFCVEDGMVDPSMAAEPDAIAVTARRIQPNTRTGRFTSLLAFASDCATQCPERPRGRRDEIEPYGCNLSKSNEKSLKSKLRVPTQNQRPRPLLARCVGLTLQTPGRRARKSMFSQIINNRGWLD